MTDTPTNAQLVADLIVLLTAEPQADDVFIGPPQTGGIGRLFGGQVLAQALQAAQATVTDGKAAHSLHAYFLRSGREGAPIELRIARDFEGRSFANRRVVALQQAEDGTATPILNLTASFQLPEQGLEHCDAPMPEVPGPEDLRPDSEGRRELIEKFGAFMTEPQRRLLLRPRAIELRPVDELHWMSQAPREPRAHTWFRLAAPITGADDTPTMHRAIITYASDYSLLGTSALPHGLSWFRGEMIGASLDHAIWFHREARADEWLLYATDAPWSGAGRGFNRGRIFTRTGELVASVAQEGMIRKRL